MDQALEKTVHSSSNFVNITKLVQTCLRESEFIIKALDKCSIHCKELVLYPALYQDFLDVTKWEMGGMWFGSRIPLPPITWFVQWPPAINRKLHTKDKTGGPISIPELELTRILLQWLTL